jgi:hypothetical protein
MKPSADEIQIIDEYEPFLDLYGDMPGMRTVVGVRFRGKIYNVAYVHSAIDGYDEETDNACFALDGAGLTGALVEAMGEEWPLGREEAEALINSACARVVETDGGVVLGYSA